MNKYLIYNPYDDTYLNCGDSVYHVHEKDLWVDDPDEATLFNSLGEIWEYLDDYDYERRISVVQAHVQISPDHTTDYFPIKEERAVNMISTILDDEFLTQAQKNRMMEWVQKESGSKAAFKDIGAIVQKAYEIYTDEGVNHPSLQGKFAPKSDIADSPKPKIKKRKKAPPSTLGHRDPIDPSNNSYV